MTTTTELAAWLDSLPANGEVWIDEGGLTLVCPIASAYFEVGGQPEEPNPNPLNEYPYGPDND